MRVFHSELTLQAISGILWALGTADCVAFPDGCPSNTVVSKYLVQPFKGASMVRGILITLACQA